MKDNKHTKIKTSWATYPGIIMKKFFESKIALAVFIIIAFVLILLLSQYLILVGIYSFLLGAFAGFCYTNQYWKIKFDKLKEYIEDWKRENKHN